MTYNKPLYSSAEGINPKIGGGYPKKIPETNVLETVVTAINGKWTPLMDAISKQLIDTINAVINDECN